MGWRETRAEGRREAVGRSPFGVIVRQKRSPSPPGTQKAAKNGPEKSPKKPKETAGRPPVVKKSGSDLTRVRFVVGDFWSENHEGFY